MNLKAVYTRPLRIFGPLITAIIEFRPRDIEDAVVFFYISLTKFVSGATPSQVFDLDSLKPVGVLMILYVVIVEIMNGTFSDLRLRY